MRKIGIVILFFTLAVTANAQKWIDMGVRDENGDIIYWSSSDFALYDNGTVVFVEYGQSGSTFGWGDISGEKTGSLLSQYGGQNPLSNIAGNPRYDIVTAKLGSSYRLPTHKEIQDLLDNCEITETTIDRGTPRGTNGLPSWVQGQWMINDAVLVRGTFGDGVINSSVSVRIDGGIASYYCTSTNDYWEGPYSYTDGKIVIGKLNLIVDDDKKVLKDIRGDVFSKISNHTVSNKVTGILFTSKINGNTLLFAMPSAVSTYSSGEYTIVTTNPQEMDYWTGTLFDRDNDCAVCMKMASDGYGVIAQPRSYHKRIRAIKVDVGSGAKEKAEREEQARIEREKAQQEKEARELHAQLEKERREAEEARKKVEMDAMYNALIGTWKAKATRKHGEVVVVIDTNHLYAKTYGWDGYDGRLKIEKEGTVIKLNPSEWQWEVIEKTNNGRSSYWYGYGDDYETIVNSRQIIVDKDNNVWMIIRRSYPNGKTIGETEIKLKKNRMGDRK